MIGDDGLQFPDPNAPCAAWVRRASGLNSCVACWFLFKDTSGSKYIYGAQYLIYGALLNVCIHIPTQFCSCMCKYSVLHASLDLLLGAPL